MKWIVSVAQTRAPTKHLQEELKKTEKWIAEAARRQSNFILFPEMWLHGFDNQYHLQLIHSLQEIPEHMAHLAKTYGIWIGGTFLTKQDNAFFNTAFIFNDKGECIHTYHKTHLFGFEKKHLSPGTILTSFETTWGKGALAVCYEVRFPEIFRFYALQGIHWLFVPAAFPYPRREHWNILLRARAIENQVFIIAANQVGQEILSDQKLHYFGTSVIVDPWGNLVIQGGEEDEQLLTVSLDSNKIQTVRELIPVFTDRKPDLYSL